MANMTVTQVKNETRTKCVETLRTMLETAYGTENVIQVGDSEFTAMVGLAPTGEKMYVNFAPTVKEYVNRTTTKKQFVAYDGVAEGKKYSDSVQRKADEKAEKDRAKADKIAKDKERREKAKADKEKAE